MTSLATAPRTRKTSKPRQPQPFSARLTIVINDVAYGVEVLAIDASIGTRAYRLSKVGATMPCTTSTRTASASRIATAPRISTTTRATT